MLRNTEIQVKLLDGIINSLNQYLLNNKNKVRKNESGRSSDIETIAECVYDCFDLKMNEMIDDVLSDENLLSPEPSLLPLPGKIKNIASQRSVIESNNFFTALDKIKSHPFKKGWRGQSELKSGIDNVIQEQFLFYNIQRTNEDLLDVTRGVSRFFNQNTSREAYILFYATNPSDDNIYFVYPQILNRLSACLKSQEFLNGNVSVQIKKDFYYVIAGRTLGPLASQIKEKSLCFGLKISLLLSDIKQMQANKQFADILGKVCELEIFELNSNNINKLSQLAVSFDASTGKIVAREIKRPTQER